MSEIDSLNPWTTEQIVSGKAILFLGTGAAKNAISPHGPYNIDSNTLRDRLSDHFLGGTYKNKPLVLVADYCKNIAGLIAVQTFIKDLFEEYSPAPFHTLIPTFRWHSIFTTNYDLIVEKAYEQCSSRKQNLAKIVHDRDDFSAKMSDPQSVPYIKLHGCISIINDPDLPLVLGSEEYARCRKNRMLLFGHLQDWSREHPVFFCGYNIADPNIQQILFDLSNPSEMRPLYVVVDPNLNQYDISMWSSRRFIPLKMTFEAFMNSLSTEIPEYKRSLSMYYHENPLPILNIASNKAAPTPDLVRYLDEQLEYVYKDMATNGIAPQDFYRGINDSWGPYVQNLDVKRQITEDLLYYPILDEGPKKIRLSLVKGFAGSGKTAVLRRTAWDAVNIYGMVVFWLREGGNIIPNLIKELSLLIMKPIIIFIDDAIPQASKITSLISLSHNSNLQIYLIISARTNELNTYADFLEKQVDTTHSIRNLSQDEILLLIENLTKHNCLGVMEHLSKNDQIKYFYLTSERQLLVALHEATLGEKFEDILFDEYNKIIPHEAQILYLDIATLNRLNIGVRAGLISRVSGISFDKFQKDFFSPLEHIVKAIWDNTDRDFLYKTRHPFIANMVFNKVLPDPKDRLTQIVRILHHLNVDYYTDNCAFSEIIRGKSIAKLFKDRSFCEQIYNIAASITSSTSYIEHQRAVFELNHPNGDIQKAWIAIKKAEVSSEPSQKAAINHTKALVLRELSAHSTTSIDKDRYRKEAQTILVDLTRDRKTPHPFHTLAQTYIDELADYFPRLPTLSTLDSINSRTFLDIVYKAQETINNGLSLFPSDEYLLSYSARLAKMLENNERAIAILQEGFAKNPHSSFIAICLSKSYKKDNLTKSIDILRKCIEDNPMSKEAHLELAIILIELDEDTNKAEIDHHLKVSFTDGDSNFQAQLWSARHHFLFGPRERAIKLFADLKSTSLPPDIKAKALGLYKNADGSLKILSGIIIAIGDSHCIVNCLILNSEIAVALQYFSKRDEWYKIYLGMTIQFNLGFNFYGPQGINATISNL